MNKLFIMILTMCLVGCESLQEISSNPTGTSGKVVDSVREQIEQAREITEATDGVSGSLTDIDTEAEAILNEIALVPTDRNYNIDPTLYSIESSADAIKEHVDTAEKEQVRIEEALEDLDAANSRVAAAVGEVEQLEELIKGYEESDREVRKQALENMHSYITLFFVMGFGMLVGGAFLTFWVSGKLGGVVLAIGVLTVGFAAASQYYLEEIAIVGLVVLIVGFFATLGVVGWMLIKGKNNEKAIAEIVELIEEAKDRLSEEERRDLFGRDGFATRLTSPLTKKIVAEVKIKNGFKHLTKNKPST
tara:strand:+ start:3365 stop:4279 length:915 start_codon:yes stop_codon:yes gene_type:complete